jgi:hypothetical protein
MDQALYMAAPDGDTSATDWRLLDKFVASQLFNHGDTNQKDSASYSNPAVQVFQAENKHEEDLDYASTTAGSSRGEVHLWK